MSKLFIKEVTSCDDCPHGWAGFSITKGVFCYLSEKPIDSEEIPEWCKLEDVKCDKKAPDEVS